MTEVFPPEHSIPSPVLDQGMDNSCSGHATAAGWNGMMQVMPGPGSCDPRFPWNMARHIATGGGPDGLGVSGPLLQEAIETFGLLMVGESTGWPYTPEQMALAATRRCKLVPVPETSIYVRHLEFKRQLCHGRPILIEFNRAQGFGNGTDAKDWTKHDWPAGGLPEADTHWACITGYRDVAGRFKVQNSSGPFWGDGGYFGLPFGHVTSYGTIKSAYVLDRIPGHCYARAPGYTPATRSTLTNAELMAFGMRRFAKAKAQLIAAAVNGPQGIADAAADLDMSTSVLECAFDMPKGAMREFERDNPSIDLSRLVFDV